MPTMAEAAALQQKKKVHAGHRGHERKDRSLPRWEHRHRIWTTRCVEADTKDF